MPLSRRSFGLAALGAAIIPAALPLVTPARAKAPLAESPAPGFYRIKLGSAQVTVLNDGVLPLEAKIFTGDPASAEALLARNFLSPKVVRTSVNEWLVNTGDRLILVDTGTATLFGPSLGHLGANLKAAGVQPGDVDAVVLTHLHPDHAGGLAADGKAAFPNATLHVAETEHAFWTSDAIADQAPAEAKAFFAIAKSGVKPYADSGRLMLFKDGAELFPGVSAVMAPGHTVGHSMLRVSSGGSELLIWGDIVHNAALQFPEPERAISFDTDQAQAIASRKKVLDMVATDRLMIAGAHLAFPGVGHVAKDGTGYRFVPRPSSED